MRWFWAVYSFIWWRLPGNRRRYRELLRHALKDDNFTFTIRHITYHYWVEHIRKPDRWSSVK
jgi:hypothetical protein